MKNKKYVNGKVYDLSDFAKAKQVFIELGLYPKYANFGPYLTNHENLIVKSKKDIVTVSGYIFTEVLLNLGGDEISEKWAWFRPE